MNISTSTASPLVICLVQETVRPAAMVLWRYGLGFTYSTVNSEKVL